MLGHTRRWLIERCLSALSDLNRGTGTQDWVVSDILGGVGPGLLRIDYWERRLGGLRNSMLGAERFNYFWVCIQKAQSSPILR